MFAIRVYTKRLILIYKTIRVFWAKGSASSEVHRAEMSLHFNVHSDKMTPNEGQNFDE